jgi:hypothetical protein
MSKSDERITFYGDTTWRVILTKAMALNEETWKNVEAHTFNDETDPYPNLRADRVESRLAFTLWTKDRVYFPATYDGSYWVDWVSRNPDGNAKEAIGGG